MRKNSFMKKLRSVAIVIGAGAVIISVIGSSFAFASPVEDQVPFRVGVGQDDANSPALIKNLQLSNELVKSKYSSDTDLLRFLRGTYAEACVRGIINESVKLIRSNQDRQYSKEEVDSASQIYEMGRIWKLTSLEMEALFGNGYVHGAYYCDCLIKELTSDELVDPVKGLEVIDELSASTQATCERLADEKAVLYGKRYGS